MLVAITFPDGSDTNLKQPLPARPPSCMAATVKSGEIAASENPSRRACTTARRSLDQEWSGSNRRDPSCIGQTACHADRIRRCCLPHNIDHTKILARSVRAGFHVNAPTLPAQARVGHPSPTCSLGRHPARVHKVDFPIRTSPSGRLLNLLPYFLH